MNTQQHIPFAVIIGAILVASGSLYQEAYATSTDDVMSMMIEANTKLTNLKNTDGDFDQMAMGKTSFEIKQIKEILLEINELNDKNGDKVNKIYGYLTSEYDTVFEKYQKDVKAYQKENGLSIQEKKITSDIFKNKLIFKNAEIQQNEEIAKKELIIKTIKENKAKNDYQKLVNTIGAKLADDANGSKVEKIHHKIAIKEIMSEKTWELTIPAIDRVITQVNNDEFKEKLTKIKNNIKELLDKKEKQSKQDQIFTLKNEKSVTGVNLIDFEQGIIIDESLEQINEEEIIEALTVFEEVTGESDNINLIEIVVEIEATQSLEEITEIISEDEDQIEEKVKKQNKINNDKKSNKAKNVLSEKQSKSNNGNGNGNNGNGNGNNGNGNGNNGNNDNGKGKNK